MLRPIHQASQALLVTHSKHFPLIDGYLLQQTSPSRLDATFGKQGRGPGNSSISLLVKNDSFH